MEGREQRSRRRRPLIVEVKVQQSDEVYLYTARNLSVGGMFIDTPVPLPPGTDLALEFKLPGGDALEVGGEVRWNTNSGAPGVRIKHPGMGVGFKDLPPTGHQRLLSWVEGS
ncbi:MAG: hypothetical protein GY898_09075 [Proteobacteria bacterium]|nr:hypothetical protein [Pseudomonadota bacterium]